MGTACAKFTRSGSISAKVAFNVFLLLLVAGASLVAAAQDEDDNNNNASSVAVTEASSPAGAGGGDVGTERVGGDKGLKVKPPNDGNVPNCPKCPRFTVPEGCSYIPSTVKAPENARRRVLLEAIVDDEDEEEEEEEEAEAEEASLSTVEGRHHHPRSERASPEAVLDETDAEVHGERFEREIIERGGGAGGRRRLLQRPRGGGGGARGGRRGRPGTRVRPRKGTARQATFSPPSEELTARATAVLRRWKEMDQADLCGLWTKHCIQGYLKRNDSIGLNITRSWDHPRHPLKRIFKKGVVPDEKDWDKWFPDLKPGAFGTCAVVAVGDVLLTAKRGSEIDAHDTVIRYNAPLKRYKAAVGSKSDVIYWKVRGEEKEYGQEGQKPSRYVMFKDETKLWMVAKPKEVSDNKYLNKPILWPSTRRGELMEVVYGGYKTERKLDRGAASGGNKLAGDILASGLCTRVDLYGYTAKGTAKYFNKGKAMSTVHIMGLEHWAYRLAQQEGMMCVYD